MERVTLRELIVSARTADALVYTVGVAGVVAGGLFARSGSLGFALVAIALTFVAGASLRMLSVIARGIADLKQSQQQANSDSLPPVPPRDPDAPPDPYRRWGGWH